MVCKKHLASKHSATITIVAVLVFSVHVAANAQSSKQSSEASNEQGHQHNHASGDDQHSESMPDTTNTTMSVANSVLGDATFIEQKATNFIQRANSIRKQVKTLRAKERGIEDADLRAAHKSSVDALAEQIEHWQNSSAELRDLSDRLKEVSMSLFVEGFSRQWSDWINNPQALATDASLEEQTTAHNNQIRSAHPSMKGLTPDTSEMPAKHEGMTMQVPELVSQPPTDNLNVSSFQISRDQNFLAHIEVEATEADAKVPLNEIHQWRLLVSDLHGKPVENATIDIVGHMPGHVHGLPTQPQVTQELAPGVYRVDGVKFQMQGWWIIEFNIEAAALADTIKFDLLL